ncbi:MAG: polysaccharide biosynthesis protein [Flavobacteriales bacterium]|nr:polysaccharide biosynthesis protein [Flavobacteriales bacterium]
MAGRLFPRWGILFIDLVLCMVALASAYLLRFNFKVPAHEVDLLLPVLPLFLIVRAATFLIAGIPRIMVRHTSTEDARRLFLTVAAGTAVLGAISLLRYLLLDGQYFLPRAVIIIEFMATAMLVISARIAFKLLHLRSQGAGKERVRVIIHGAGEAGLITKRTLEREGSVKYEVVAFTDDDERKAGKRLEGVGITHTGRLPALLAEGIDQVIIAIGKPDPEKRRRVVDACIAAKVQVRTIPPVNHWINGQLSAGQIQQVRIEDLLGRAVIHLEQEAVRRLVAGKRVLVTGAAGSIGSELVRQLAEMEPASLALIDIAESGLYDVQMELVGKGRSEKLHVHVADVRDGNRMEAVFAHERPQLVFHAAAYKHVPLMEAQPEEAVRTNLGGTGTVARLACKHGAERFVLISTDKAVNPTSVMGASKRAAEMLVGAIAQGCGTVFVTTRFGNVLGSSGSVIPLFRKQIEAGGPVTVTHPEVTRFFMTIPESCRLVMEAAAMGQGGEIYVFDMGQPVRIAELADKMIRLSGKEPGSEIAITYTGLRPGEKLYEELLATTENTVPTHHPRILIGQVTPVDADDVLRRTDALLRMESHEAMQALKDMIPEYGIGPRPPASTGTPSHPML